MRGRCRAPPRRSASSSRATARWRASGHVPGVRAGCRRKAAYRGPELVRPWKVSSHRASPFQPWPRHHVGLANATQACWRGWATRPPSTSTWTEAWIRRTSKSFCPSSCVGEGRSMIISLTLQASVLTNHPSPPPQAITFATPLHNPVRPTLLFNLGATHRSVGSPADLRACSPVRRTPMRPSASQRGDSVLKRERSPHRAAEGCSKASP